MKNIFTKLQICLSIIVLTILSVSIGIAAPDSVGTLPLTDDILRSKAAFAVVKQKIAYRVSYNDWFPREITEKGKVLYESADFFLKPTKKEKCAMNPLTLEWIQKAESDYTIMRQNHQSSTPVYDAT